MSDTGPRASAAFQRLGHKEEALAPVGLLTSRGLVGLVY